MASSTSPPCSRFFAKLGFAIFSFVVTVALLELLSWTVWTGKVWLHPDPYPALAASPAYAGATWASEYWREQSQWLKSRRTYAPFRVWGMNEWHGKYINTDTSEIGIWRRTANSMNDTCEKQARASIWVFGGSSVFGTGVPDWATLPSYVAGDWNRAGMGCVAVTNFGIEGYVAMQELVLLIEQLKAGRHPDIVIFYDGFNDATLAMYGPGPRSAHFEFGTIKARIEGSGSGRFDFLQKSYTLRLAGAVVAHFRRDRSSLAPAAGSHPGDAAVLDNYEASLRVARALSQAYNFRFYAFWQPTLLYGQKPLVPFEQQIARLDADPTRGRMDSNAIAAVYREAEGRAEKNHDFVFLGSLFDATATPMFTDEVHCGPMGNEMAAQAIVGFVKGHSGQ